jgi:hypothetical protein
MSVGPVSLGGADEVSGPGIPPPHDGGPSSPKKRRAALIIVLAVCLLGAVIAMIGVTRGDPRKADAKAAREAGRNLTKTAVLTLSGTYGTRQATFTVTTGGTARGTYTAGGEQVSRIDVGSTTYLNARQRFWTAHGESSAIARKADGRWTQAPYGYAELGLVSLSPAHLGQNLLDPGNSPHAVKTSLDGVKAIRLTTAGLTYFVSTSEPHRVLRVQGRTVSDAFSFDTTPLSATATFFTGLRKDVQGLKDAYNPNVGFLPAGATPHFSGCGESGCTVSGKIQPDAAGGSGKIHVVTTVEFQGTTGGVVSRCTDSAMATSKLLVKFSCRTSGSAWTSWYRSHNGRFTIRAIPMFEATVNSAQDISHLLLMLTQEQQQTS